ncbi:MAG TPA: hypothetical protein VHE81_16330, partial [Lacipirellulaceae bacterium]|nr:hypothetical protein [Lacipirellulaceae bacterium]
MKLHFIETFERWTRVEWLLAAIAVALLVGAALPWYTMPADTLAAFGTSLWVPLVLRVLPLIAAVYVVRMLVLPSNGAQRRRFRMFLWAAMPIAFLFPFIVATLS